MSLLRRIGIILAVATGALLGAALAFFIVGLNAPVLALAALLGAVVYGGLAWRLALSGSRGWLALAAVPVGLALLFGAGTLYALYQTGQIAVPTDDRLANFDRLWQAVSVTYPYFDIKEVDWNATRDRYRPRVEAAASDAEYYALVADMLAELNDSHTYLARPYPQWGWQFGTLQPVGEMAVITGRDATARDAGLQRGDVVTAINGQPVAAAIEALPPALRVGSTPWNARAFALGNLLIAWDDTRALTLTVETAAGESSTVTLAVPDSPPPADGDRPPLITAETLPSGIGLIRIPQFFGAPQAELVAQFDTALNALADAPALVLDVRGNGGGSSLTAAAMAGRFLTETFEYGRECYRQRLPVRMWLGCGTRVVYPRAPHDARPLVILTDERVASSAEEFVLMLADSGRARTAGRPTAGSSGNPLRFPLTGGGEAQFSSGDLRRRSGERLEGAGIQPDVSVTWTLDDLRAGRDPDAAAAETLLTGP